MLPDEMERLIERIFADIADLKEEMTPMEWFDFCVTLNRRLNE